MKFFIAGLFLVVTASSAFAACPNKAPNNNWNMRSGDQKVNAAFLEKNLAGKRVRYKIPNGTGTEAYNSDGTYDYKLNSDTYSAASYRFYRNGVRCIGYDEPRFDRYVVNNGKLLLINWQGGRFEGKLMN